MQVVSSKDDNTAQVASNRAVIMATELAQDTIELLAWAEAVAKIIDSEREADFARVRAEIEGACA